MLHVVDPADWARQGMIAGTPFALAHTFAQTGPFRPANMVRGIDNVVLAGSSTVPGVGVPTALMSGRLAADRITGVVDGSTRTVAAKAGAVMIRSELTRPASTIPTCARRIAGVVSSTRRTAARSSWPPGYWRPISARRSTRCTASPGTPTTSSTISTRR